MCHRKHLRAALVVALACGACTIGRPLNDLRPTSGPQGTRARVTYGNAGPAITIEGELVAVRDDGLLLLARDRLTLVRYGVLREARFPDTTRVGRFRRSANERQRRALAQFSRYPFGLSPDQLDRLLESLGQDQLAVIR